MVRAGQIGGGYVFEPRGKNGKGIGEGLEIPPHFPRIDNFVCDVDTRFLTDREYFVLMNRWDIEQMRVWNLEAKPLTYSQIGRVLGVSDETVGNVMTRIIRRKLVFTKHQF